MKKLFLLIPLLPLLCAGCLSTNITQLVAASGTNTNSVSISIRTIYGSAEYQRNMQGKIAQ